MNFDEAIKAIGINKEETLNRFSGNNELLEKFIKKFPEDKTIDFIKKAASEKNYNDLEESVHTMKGLSGNLGFSKLYEYSSALVNAIRAKDFSTADILTPKVIETCCKISEIIKTMD